VELGVKITSKIALQIAESFVIMSELESRLSFS